MDDANVLQAENKGEPFAAFDVTVDVGPVAAPRMGLALAEGYSFGNPTMAERGAGGQWQKTRVSRLAASTLRFEEKWYFEPLGPPVVGTKVPLVLLLDET